jgi:hypothetical protein
VGRPGAWPLAVVLISAIPVAGRWLEALLVLLGLGALGLMLRPWPPPARRRETGLIPHPGTGSNPSYPG